MSYVGIAAVLVTDDLCTAQHRQTVNQSSRARASCRVALTATVVSVAAAWLCRAAGARSRRPAPAVSLGRVTGVSAAVTWVHSLVLISYPQHYVEGAHSQQLWKQKQEARPSSTIAAS
jgi:hypothetical protein